MKLDLGTYCSILQTCLRPTLYLAGQTETSQHMPTAQPRETGAAENFRSTGGPRGHSTPHTKTPREFPQDTMQHNDVNKHAHTNWTLRNSTLTQ